VANFERRDGRDGRDRRVEIAAGSGSHHPGLAAAIVAGVQIARGLLVSHVRRQ